MALDIKITLRVFSKTHTLAELTKILGEASAGFSLGDTYSRESKNREYTYWSFVSPSIGNCLSLDQHLEQILQFCKCKHNELLMLRKQGCNIDTFCMLASDNGQGGAFLSTQSMGQLAENDLSITFDVYADYDDK